LAGDAEGAGANDLVVAIDASDDAADEALAAAEEALSARADGSPAAGDGEPRRLRTLAEVKSEGGGLAIISTPGHYAAAEELKALRLGLNAFVFSDNVALEQEVELKREAHERGLIVMG